jgi:UDP-2,3-diacylglucosamine pyrophosphatase LpxH
VAVEDAEAAAVARLCGRPPPRVLVVSDLHLGSGADPLTGTWPAAENFLADGAFAAWLEHYAPQAEDTVLILNGDIFDVLRVADVPATGAELSRWSQRLTALGVPRSPQELRASIVKSERRYGLKTNDYKTVWKLMRIAEGHPRVFAALAGWVAGGGRVLLTAGNHDVELHWPLVRRAIRWELAEHGAQRELVAERVMFEDSHVVLDNLYVEHGHRYEEMTRVDGPPELPGRPDEINLPLGSFVNRYVINRVEALDPFLDNVKPVQRSLLRLARQRPLKILGTYFGAWRFLLRALAKRRLNTSVLTIAAALALPPIVAPLALVLLTPFRDTVLGFLPAGVGTVVTIVIGVLLSGAFPYVAGVLGELVRRGPGTDRQLEGSRRAVATALASGTRTRRYVCMGHTHVCTVERIDDAGEHLYLNTGTWIALWPEDRPDLVGRTVYTYALFEAGADGYAGAALEWDEHADRPRPARILVLRQPA